MVSTAAETVVDLAFGVRGGTIAADHGYALFGALCRVVPWLHGAEGVGVHPIGGQLIGGRQLALTERSRLVLRLPAGRIAEALPLAGAVLEVDGSPITLGAPRAHELRPAAALRSRLVTIKGFMEPGEFLAAVARQLDALEVEARPALFARQAARSVEGRNSAVAATVVRRTLRVREKQVVGFPVMLAGLTAEESLRVQDSGVGGRRRLGCGVFVPAVR